MDHLIDVATKVSWPGALVLAVLILGIAGAVISVFGSWPTLISKTTVINNHYPDAPDKKGAKV